MVQRLADGSECAAVVLDTEGIGGLEADAQYDTRIFALSTLLAGTLLYNSLGSIDENAISQLSFVAQLSKHIRFRATPEASGMATARLHQRSSNVEMEDEEDAARLTALMPSFAWVLRDFALELVDAHGDSITCDEYLEHALKPQKGYEASVLERNRLRHVLTSFFPRRSCHALVRPVHDENKLQQIDDLPASELRPEFVAGVENLRDALFAPENLRPKTISGAPIRGPAYVELLRQYVDAINSGGVPVISSAWDHVSQLECRYASEDAHALFLAQLDKQRHVIKSQKTPLETDMLEASAKRATELAFDAFERRAVGDAAAEARNDLQAKLKAETVELEKANHRASERYCDDLANKLYVSVVWAGLAAVGAETGPDNDDAAALSSGETPSDLAANLVASWAELRKRYAAHAKGPAKDVTLLRFVTDKWPEAAHELVRRIDARHELDAQREHDRLVKVKGELAEIEGSKEARVKMLEDAQHTLMQTQMEKVRAEARSAAIAKQLDEARSKEKETRVQLERTVGDLELEIERLRNQLSTADRFREINSKPSNRAEDTRTAEIVDGKGGCKCTIS